jgi:UDP-N-acetylglucosamine--N-acetylmuramyl-(pentapeptide) pyrophosphoryl-undecaprenol N-acetylglucosamine transferase
MLFVLSGGGTAGHINPALALADVLQERGHQVVFAGTPQGIESRLVPRAGLPFKPFEAAGFNRRHPLTLFHALRLINASTKKAKAWFDEIHPDAVVGFGGYVCIPVARAAEAKDIPVVVHEQNSVMGIANKLLAKKARAVALTYKVAGESVEDKSKLVVTGNPVRASIFDATREQGRTMLNIPVDALMLLVFGGSLGARHINAALCELKDRLLAIDNLYIVHITGPKELGTVQHDLALTDEQAKRWQVMGYQNRMGETMAAADMVVSRAGATSLAEISGRQIPALLVPFPYATADHQTVNAREYVEAGAAYMVPDDQVEGPEFAEKLFRMIRDPEVRRAMHEAGAKFGTRDAAGNLADVVIGAAFHR